MRTVSKTLRVRAEWERLLQRKRLRFPEPLERQFRDDYFDRWLATNRAAFIGGLLILPRSTLCSWRPSWWAAA